uniref:Uncharacterized protein n=1 Tax=Rhizophora mucronata TaxID=61149 RepID=A0A2P2QRN7_RHIMU
MPISDKQALVWDQKALQQLHNNVHLFNSSRYSRHEPTTSDNSGPNFPSLLIAFSYLDQKANGTMDFKKIMTLYRFVCTNCSKL